MAATNVTRLQKAGVLASSHKISEEHQARINSLKSDEVKALISAKNKLGTDMLTKTAKGGKFPHQDSMSY